LAEIFHLIPRLVESELAHHHWGIKAVAGQAEEKAQSWQRATLIREDFAALLGMAQDHPESTEWAQWPGKYADWIDPLTADLLAMPAIREPAIGNCSGNAVRRLS
jgi:hypothetical protein